MNDESKFNHHSIALDQVRFHYLTAGSGDPVLNGEGLEIRGHDRQGIVRIDFCWVLVGRT